MLRTRIFIVFFVALGASAWLQAQDLSVPDSIRKELKTVVLTGGNGDALRVLVRYPDNYDPKKEYPVFLGISGGGQSEPVAAYCYAAWFRNLLFKDYLTIMPVNDKAGSFRDADKDAIADILAKIKEHFPVKEKDWLVAGTSNGGVATFSFVAAAPKLFKGVAVVPGALSDAIEVGEDWAHLTIVLAYGEDDAEDWINASKASGNKLEGKVKRVAVITLPGQGHMLPIGYDLTSVYQRLFDR